MKYIVSIILILVVFNSNAAETTNEIEKQSWGFSGPFGTYDKTKLQRGLQVYKEVCSTCHSLKYIAFRNLSDLGYNQNEIKYFASEYTVIDGPNLDGEMFERPGKPSDYFVSPFSNENAARAANGGAYPPDLSLILYFSFILPYKSPPSAKSITMHNFPFFVL